MYRILLIYNSMFALIRLNSIVMLSIKNTNVFLSKKGVRWKSALSKKELHGCQKRSGICMKNMQSINTVDSGSHHFFLLY